MLLTDRQINRKTNQHYRKHNLLAKKVNIEDFKQIYIMPT